MENVKNEGRLEQNKKKKFGEPPGLDLKEVYIYVNLYQFFCVTNILPTMLKLWVPCVCVFACSLGMDKPICPEIGMLMFWK
jgi:hypothetical protein